MKKNLLLLKDLFGLKHMTSISINVYFVDNVDNTITLFIEQ